MDTESRTNISINEPDYIRAWNIVLWLNFKHGNLFSIIDETGPDFLVVSQDMRENFDNPSVMAFDPHYEGLDSTVVEIIRNDPSPLEHWSEILDMFISMDGDILRFIISHKIPLEKFIRHELGSRGCDDNGAWVGVEKSKKIWTQE